MDEMEERNEELRNDINQLKEQMTQILEMLQSIQVKNVEGTPQLIRGELSTSPAYPPGFTSIPAQPYLNKPSQQVDPPEVQWPPYGLPPNYIPPIIIDPPNKHQPLVNHPPTQMQPTQPEVSIMNVISYKHQVPYQPQNSNFINQRNLHQTSGGYQPTSGIEHVQSSEKLQMLEERLKVVEGGSYDIGEAVDLCLVPDIEFPSKFKVPEFDKYKRTSCPKNHMTMYCRKMAAYARNDKLLIHCFQDSLTREL
ncbi:uncharacterized protein LOC109793295 [Cajanus cajan]|uniref:uncharacterized protein LOC109793295 n=1 Tax=Cajanus cajan TaxID=3821 RepID=UPI00098DC2FB|nr:uncharacterized protein LOC109793295 [Cajanus cajan]